MTWFEEKLYEHWRQSFKIGRVLFHEKTDFQDLVIFETPGFQRVLALDGIIQVTQGDEFVYHEMLAHVSTLAHGDARAVLIIGGGDGGVLREVLRHPVERCTMVEIDPGVIELCRKFMPDISRGAFDDPRAEIVIADGVKYVAETDRKFDVIIVDSTDPIGPGEVLFTEAFYASCRRILTERGVVVTQNGVPFLQPEELTTTHRRLSKLFPDAGFFVAAVPTYVGGFMTLGWASLDPSNRARPVEAIREQFTKLQINTRYYTPEIHVASFALPKYVQDLMTKE